MSEVTRKAGAAAASLLITVLLPVRAVCAPITLRPVALKINVTDMREAVQFYVDKLGFAVEDRSAYPREVILKSTAAPKLVLHEVARIRKAGPMESQAGVTLQVNDLDRAMARMKAHHVPFGEAKPRQEAVGRAIYIVTPSGMRISLMHETVVHNDPFPEPRVYNFGVLVPEMAEARAFYATKLGFVVRSEKYLPLDLPLGRPDGTFAFMLHYRPAVSAVPPEERAAASYITIVFETDALEQTVRELNASGVETRPLPSGGVSVEDPFGNVSEIVESRPAESVFLRRLYDQKRMLELRRELARRPSGGGELLFYRGAVENALHHSAESAKSLDAFIAGAASNDEHLIDAYALRADDAAAIFDYAKAADLYRTLLERFRSTIPASDLPDYENKVALYSALRDVPRQRVSTAARRLNRPTARPGWLVPVVANGARFDLGIDTGANISLLIRSVAEKLGVRMLDRSISIGSVTTIKVQPRLGFLPRMNVGGITVRNAIFIVLDDQLMTFPDGTVIQGVIGFPVIAAFGRVTFFGDGSVRAGGAAASRGGTPNIFLDGRNVVFQGEYGGYELPLLLDTGAERSMLYVPFLEAFKKEIVDKAPLRSERFAGVGGTEEVPAYVLQDLAMRFSGKEVRLPEVRLMTKALTDAAKTYYGNIGGDLLKRFRSVTLDFRSMRIEFD